jgi:hypothetical protein
LKHYKLLSISLEKYNVYLLKVMKVHCFEAIMGPKGHLEKKRYPRT